MHSADGIGDDVGVADGLVHGFALLRVELASHRASGAAVRDAPGLEDAGGEHGDHVDGVPRGRGGPVWDRVSESSVVGSAELVAAVLERVLLVLPGGGVLVVVPADLGGGVPDCDHATVRRRGAQVAHLRMDTRCQLRVPDPGLSGRLLQPGRRRRTPQEVVLRLEAPHRRRELGRGHLLRPVGALGRTHLQARRIKAHGAINPLEAQRTDRPALSQAPRGPFVVALPLALAPSPRQSPAPRTMCHGRRLRVQFEKTSVTATSSPRRIRAGRSLFYRMSSFDNHRPRSRFLMFHPQL